MIQNWNVFLVAVCIVYGVSSFPQNNGSGSNAHDLKHTFQNEGEIPAGFFDAPETMEKPSPPTLERDQRSFPACQDGSGGMCIPAGQCPAELKAVTNPRRIACTPGQECCYGGPLNSKTPCKDKGGQCTAPPRSCGNGPKLTSGTECNHENGETCCIWIF